MKKIRLIRIMRTWQGKAKKNTSRFKSVRLSVYPYKNNGRNYWRFAYPDASAKGGWRYGTRATRKDAREAAHRKAVEIANGTLDLANLEDSQKRVLRAFLDTSPTLSDIEAFIAWKTQRENSITLAECVSRYTEAKEASGVSAIYLKRLKGNLGKLVNGLPGKTLHEIDLDTLETWFDANHRHMAPKTRNNIRGTLVGLWKWARLREYLDDAITPRSGYPPPESCANSPPPWALTRVPPHQGSETPIPRLACHVWLGGMQDRKSLPPPRQREIPPRLERLPLGKGHRHPAG